MIALNPRQSATLRAIRSAGSAGLPIGPGMTPGDAIALQAAKLAVFDQRGMRVRITAAGAAYLRRSTFA